MTSSESLVPPEWKMLQSRQVLEDSGTAQVVWARVRGYPSWPVSLLVFVLVFQDGIASILIMRIGPDRCFVSIVDNSLHVDLGASA